MNNSPQSEKRSHTSKFRHFGLNDSLVGQKVFYIDEDRWNGSPTLRRGIKSQSGKIYSLMKQDVFPYFSNVTSDHYSDTPFSPTAEKVIDTYARYIRWQIESLSDPDHSGQSSTKEKLERYLAKIQSQPLIKIVNEARAALDKALKGKAWSEIPVQEYKIGEKVEDANGKEQEVRLVELVGEHSVSLTNARSLRLNYYNEMVEPIQLQS